MKTRYKILIVIAITLFVFVVLRIGLIHICNSMSENCGIFYDFFDFTSIHIPNNIVGGGAVEWSGTAQPEFKIDYTWYALKNLNFVFFFIIIPISTIATILYRNRK